MAQVKSQRAQYSSASSGESRKRNDGELAMRLSNSKDTVFDPKHNVEKNVTSQAQSYY